MTEPVILKRPYSKIIPKLEILNSNFKEHRMIQTKGLSGAQTMLRVLGEMGVERIFASPGSEWSPVWEALARQELRA